MMFLVLCAGVALGAAGCNMLRSTQEELASHRAAKQAKEDAEEIKRLREQVARLIGR